jgi:hypothetical protein
MMQSFPSAVFAEAATMTTPIRADNPAATNSVGTNENTARAEAAGGVVRTLKEGIKRSD